MTGTEKLNREARQMRRVWHKLSYLTRRRHRSGSNLLRQDFLWRQILRCFLMRVKVRWRENELTEPEQDSGKYCFFLCWIFCLHFFFFVCLSRFAFVFIKNLLRCIFIASMSSPCFYIILKDRKNERGRDTTSVRNSTNLPWLFVRIVYFKFALK